MKKRFQNILIKNRKKNGIFILICTVVLTISLGTLAGCSVAKGDREKENTENENTENEITKEQSTVKQSMENTTILTFFKEGIQEQKQATLAIGDGYSVFLPDEEEWRLSAPDMWTTAINDQVTLWVTHFEGESADSVVRKLESRWVNRSDSTPVCLTRQQ